MTTAQKLESVRSMINELSEIQQRPLQYAALDMAAWMGQKLDKVNELLEEIALEQEMDTMAREFHWKAEREIEGEKTA